MKFEFKAVIERTVRETFNIVVTEDNVHDAEDLVYEALSEYPDSFLVLDRLMKIGEENVGTPEILNITVQESEVDKVFEEEEYDPA